MEIKGRIIEIGNMVVGRSEKTGKEWRVVEFVVEYKDGTFDKYLAMAARTDSAITQIQGIDIGDEVNVLFNLESFNKKGRWFTSANAWKIRKV